jgi:hypothetical protein
MNFRRLLFEPLEDRRLLATLTVNSLLDVVDANDGLVTLREAVTAANTDTQTELNETGNGADVIQFAGSLSGDIVLSIVGDSYNASSALAITSPVTIAGSTGVSTIRRGELAPAMRLFVVADGGELTLRSLNITGGHVVVSGIELGVGGAVYVTSGGQLNVVASTIHGNIARGGTGAHGLGGAVFIQGGEATFLNSTVSGNSVQNGLMEVSGFGATIYCLNGSLSVYNSTVVSNVDVPGRCIYVVGGGEGGHAEFRAYNSIFAGPVGGGDVIAVADAGGQIITAGDYNIVSQGAAGFIDAVTVNPQIASLADNGGPTLTHALVVVDESHPAVDQGDPFFDPNDPDYNPLTSDAVPFDQRGAPNPRVVDGDGVFGPRVDRGAFEYRPATAGPELPGDYNGDLVVNAADYTIWRNTLGQNVTRWSGADGDGDESIGTGDYGVWKSHFGDSLNANGAAATNDAAPDAAEFERTSTDLAPRVARVSHTAEGGTKPAGDRGPLAAPTLLWPAGLVGRSPSSERDCIPKPATFSDALQRSATRFENLELELEVASFTATLAEAPDRNLAAEAATTHTSPEWDAVWSGLGLRALT